MSDRIVVFSEGNIQQIGTPLEIYHRPKARFVADFIGESNLLPAIISNVNDRVAQSPVSLAVYTMARIVSRIYTTARSNAGATTRAAKDFAFASCWIYERRNDYRNNYQLWR